MINRVAGALARALLVVLLIATPSLLLPQTSSDTAEVVALLAIFAGGLTYFEYASTSPGLVEFRDAPPFNRIRFLSLFTTVFILSVAARGQTQPSELSELFYLVGGVLGHALDFPLSPVRLVLGMMPEGTPPHTLELLRTCAALAQVVAIVSLLTFVTVLRAQNWPTSAGTFNVWVNLPTFDPNAGGDVVDRLERDARVNVALGILLPFLTPVVVGAGSVHFGSVNLDDPQTMIWVVSIWAFLPCSLFMRGIALGRIAAMIEAKRRARAALHAEGMAAPA